MSHQAIIDYEGIAIKCQSVCELAETRLKELDKTIAQIEKSSRTLINEEAIRLKESLKKERNALERQIKDVRNQADSNARFGNRRGSYEQRGVAEQVIKQAEALRRRSEEVAGRRIAEYEGLIEKLISDKLQSNYEKLMGQGDDSETLAFIQSIEDESLRNFVYVAHLENPELAGDDLIEAGRSLMGETYEERLAKEREKLRKELEASRIDTSCLDEAEKEGTSAEEKIVAMREAVSNEIVGEKVRKKSLKIIAKAIAERGFVVDERNIRINKEKNEVNFVALKASGERAEFKVYLDGRFIYHFKGYEGQACQKDIEPFMNDLEEVYGLKIKKSEEIWSNPDKISTMKYQAMNTNKNKG